MNVETKNRNAFIQQLPDKLLMSPYRLRRDSLYDDMITLFSDEDIALKQPFRVYFAGEKGIDTGGLSCEAFSTFWELAYQHHFDGSCLLTPVVSGGINNSTFQVMGRILSTCYIFIPVRIAFPCLSSILLASQGGVCVAADMLVETFRESLNPVDSISIREAFACKSGTFPQVLVNKLIGILSRFD